jgi:hypothetical protein
MAGENAIKYAGYLNIQLPDNGYHALLLRYLQYKRNPGPRRKCRGAQSYHTAFAQQPPSAGAVTFWIDVVLKLGAVGA